MPNLTPRPGTPRVHKRAVAICAIGAFVVAGSMFTAACILADPPAAVDRPPIHRPMILRDTVQPPPTRILRTWPRQFDLWIDADPASGIAWEVFFDYDPTTNNQPSTPSGHSDPDPTNDDAGVRKISVLRDAPLDQNACHTFEIVVAYEFVDAHVPGAHGGDSIVWFFAPSGDLSTCPIFDASTPDASGDADAGADAGIFVPGGQDEGG